MIEPSSVQLFTGLGRGETSVILAAAVRRNCEASQVLIRTNEPATRLFLIKTGSVDYYVITEKGQEILLRRLAPGNVFGVAAFLSEPTGYLGTARTVRESTILIWEHRVIQQLAQRYPRLTEKMPSEPLYATSPCTQKGTLDLCRTSPKRGWRVH
jgi:CRP-like cAMP-binding protein